MASPHFGRRRFAGLVRPADPQSDYDRVARFLPLDFGAAAELVTLAELRAEIASRPFDGGPEEYDAVLAFGRVVAEQKRAAWGKGHRGARKS